MLVDFFLGGLGMGMIGGILGNNKAVRRNQFRTAKQNMRVKFDVFIL